MASLSEFDREQAILSELDASGRVEVSDLSHRFGVSTVTVRKDLEGLERRGMLRRIRGGALVAPRVDEGAFDFRHRVAANAKRAVARRAASLVRPGDVIAMDSSTTCYYLAEELLRVQPLTVITNGLRTSSLLLQQSEAAVIMPGGVLRRASESMVGFLSDVLTAAAGSTRASSVSSGSASSAVCSTSRPRRRTRRRLWRRRADRSTRSSTAARSSASARTPSRPSTASPGSSPTPACPRRSTASGPARASPGTSSHRWPTSPPARRGGRDERPRPRRRRRPRRRERPGRVRRFDGERLALDVVQRFGHQPREVDGIVAGTSTACGAGSARAWPGSPSASTTSPRSASTPGASTTACSTRTAAWSTSRRATATTVSRAPRPPSSPRSAPTGSTRHRRAGHGHQHALRAGLRRREHPQRLERAATLLMMPDVVHHLLSGSRVTEHTAASTTGFYETGSGRWATDLLDELGVPTHLLPEVVAPGTDVGGLLPELATGRLAGARVLVPRATTPPAPSSAPAARPRQPLHLQRHVVARRRRGRRPRRHARHPGPPT